MPDTVIDNFLDTPATALQDHTTDSGHAYLVDANGVGSPPDLLITDTAPLCGQAVISSVSDVPPGLLHDGPIYYVENADVEGTICVVADFEILPAISGDVTYDWNGVLWNNLVTGVTLTGVGGYYLLISYSASTDLTTLRLIKADPTVYLDILDEYEIPDTATDVPSHRILFTVVNSGADYFIDVVLDTAFVISVTDTPDAEITPGGHAGLAIAHGEISGFFCRFAVGFGEPCPEDDAPPAGESISFHLPTVVSISHTEPIAMHNAQAFNLPVVTTQSRAKPMTAVATDGVTEQVSFALPVVRTTSRAADVSPGRGGGGPITYDPPHGPPIQLEASGNVLFDQCRELAGADWTAENTVGSGIKFHAAGAFGQVQHQVLYTRGNKVYLKSSPISEDWSGAAEVDTGLTGKVYGAAANSFGVICALVESKVYRSADQGVTWTEAATVALPDGSLDRQLLAVNQGFVIVYAQAGSMQHLVSEDGGATWS